MILVADANRARRRRRQTQTVLNSAQPANRNSQVDARQLPFSSQGLQQQQQPQMSQGGMGIPNSANAGQNQGGRQYYPYQNQYGMGSQGSQGSFYNPYGGGSQYGGGGSQYGYGQCKHKNLYTHTD